MNVYTDIRIIPHQGCGIPDIAGMLIDRLHRCFAKSTISFALAFPGWEQGEVPKLGDRLRIFCESGSDLDGILDEVEQDGRLYGFIHLGRSKSVPDDFKGNWVTFERFRIRQRNCTREDLKEHHAKRRLEQIGISSTLPWIRVRSQSTGQDFSISIRKQKHQSRGAPGRANSYGLSRESNKVFLPELP